MKDKESQSLFKAHPIRQPISQNLNFNNLVLFPGNRIELKKLKKRG